MGYIRRVSRLVMYKETWANQIIAMDYAALHCTALSFGLKSSIAWFCLHHFFDLSRCSRVQCNVVHGSRSNGTILMDLASDAVASCPNPQTVLHFIASGEHTNSTCHVHYTGALIATCCNLQLNIRRVTTADPIPVVSISTKEYLSVSSAFNAFELLHNRLPILGLAAWTQRVID